MQSAVWLFPDESPHQNSKDHRREWLSVSSKNQAMSPPFLLKTLSPESLRSLVLAPTKDGTPWPFSSVWQCQSAHSSNNGWLSERKRETRSCCRTHCIRQTPLPETSFSVQKSRNDWKELWERRGCVWGVHEGCWRHTPINLGWWVEQVVSTHGKVHSC